MASSSSSASVLARLGPARAVGERVVDVEDHVRDLADQQQRHLGERAGAREADIGQPPGGVDEGDALGTAFGAQTGEQLDVGDGALLR